MSHGSAPRVRTRGRGSTAGTIGRVLNVAGSAVGIFGKSRRERREDMRAHQDHAEQEKKKKRDLWLASLHGIDKEDNPDHDIYQQMDDGVIDWKAGKEAMGVRKAQRENEAAQQQQQIEQQQQAADQERAIDAATFASDPAGPVGGQPLDTRQAAGREVAEAKQPENAMQKMFREAGERRARAQFAGEAGLPPAQEAAFALGIKGSLPTERQKNVGVEVAPRPSEQRAEVRAYRQQQERTIDKQLSIHNKDKRLSVQEEAQGLAVAIIGDPKLWPPGAKESYGQALESETESQAKTLIAQQRNAAKLKLYEDMGAGGSLDAALEAIMGQIQIENEELGEIRLILQELEDEMR